MYVETIQDWAIVNDFTQLAIEQHQLEDNPISKEITKDIAQSLSRINICFKQPYLCKQLVITEPCTDEELFDEWVTIANLCINALTKHLISKT